MRAPAIRGSGHVDRTGHGEYSGSPVQRFGLAERRGSLERAADSIADVLVVGGGITGAGVAREAALRGLSVVLLDKGDFASGTSSRSSKLIHGGVRYLEQGDVALVREAARERAVIRGLAPHLARPVRMMLPARSRRGRMKLSAGLWTFEKLAGQDGIDEGYDVFDRDRCVAAEPGLRADHLAGAVMFTEYVTSDARLTLETVKSAHAAGALAASYASVEAITHEGAGVRADVHDLLGGGGLVVRARCLVNAAGPWFDRVRGLSEPGSSPVVQLTRGIHLVVPHERLPVRHVVVLRAPDGRSTFVVPRAGYSYIGTTDTLYEGDAEEPGVTAADARYLLESVAATFTDAPVAADVCGTWSGVRPLLREDGKKPSEISRRDEIRTGPGPVVSIAGGKLTTFRRMAERVVSEVVSILGGSGDGADQSLRRPLAGGGAVEQQQARAAAPRLADSTLEDRLWSTYGVAAGPIVQRIARDGAAGEAVGGIDCITAAEVGHCVAHEMVTSLDDLLRRRSHIAMFDTRRALAAARDVALHMAVEMGWDERRVAAEVDAFTRDRRGELAAANGGHPTDHEDD